MNRVLTTYFTGKPDPQPRKGNVDPVKRFYRPDHTFPPDRYDLIAPFVESARRFGLGVLIFHDELSRGFIRQNSRGGIRFCRVDLMNMSLNDQRYFFYLSHIVNNRKISSVFMCDLFDVEFYGNPFDIVRPGILYSGEEPSRGRWVGEKQRRIYGREYYPKKNSLNAGIIGGCRGVVIPLLEAMVHDLGRRGEKENANMAVYNYRARQIFGKKIVSGKPLHSRFKAYDRSGAGYIIRHK